MSEHRTSNELTARLFGLTAKVEDGEYWDPLHVAQAATDALAEIERLTAEYAAYRADSAAENNRLRAALERIATGKARDGGVADPKLFAIKTLQGSSDEPSCG